ncbi:MAG: all-trans-retinol 13,14-reductase [Thermodesulfobacteriota bacterium]|nr:all-trans-retinol 13,14-reductase [Thermodesulfobacteriota bacterium]
MKKYDDIVVGSGISGMTLALLLGMNGHSVLLLEKNRNIGGSMARFYKQGVPFDTGFHFTGGFYKNGILSDMLTVLGIDDQIQPVFITKEDGNRVIFEEDNSVYDFPFGYDETTAKMKEYFPGEKNAIEQYFKMVLDVCKKTVALDLRNLSLSQDWIDEDYISLDEVLNKLTGNKKLKGLLSKYSMCYGAKPSEISFANHSRVSLGLYESVARVKDGGDAFIRAFKKRFAGFDIDIRTNSCITECADVGNNIVGKFVLNTGEEIAANRCIFTIHPKAILDVLPKNHLTKAFISRVNAFESTAGFFSLFGVVENSVPNDKNADNTSEPTILSLFSSSDINRMMDPAYTGDPALVILKNQETMNGKTHTVLTALELAFPEHVRDWEDSRPGVRSDGYRNYKNSRIENIMKRIIGVYPEFNETFRFIDAASMLTFRDYLYSPDGSAYGIKQKVGQFNLFGKLPLRNIYAAGQSSVLPGIVGAMLSSFIIGRAIVGKEPYIGFITERLNG